MSYILTALRKAEKERKTGDAATAENFLVEPGTEARSPASGRWIILALSVALIVCIGYLVVDEGSGTGSSNAVLSPEKTVDSRREPITYKPELAGPNKQSSIVESGSAIESKKINPPAISNEPVMATRDPSRPAMPSLNITGYIYFDGEPARSKLFVDGIVYRLNSRLGQGLILTGFEKDFVIVSYYGEESRISTR